MEKRNFYTGGYRRVNIYNRGYAGNKITGSVVSGASSYTFERWVKKITVIFKSCYPDA